MPIRHPKPAPAVLLEPPPEPLREPILSTTPPQQHPDDVPLDHRQVEAALWHADGNFHRAAELLNTRPARIAYLTHRLPHLAKARQQAAELLLDHAEYVLTEALEHHEDPARQDNAARFILEKAGKTRGWSKDGGGINLAFGDAPQGAGTIAIKWDIE
jgi:hypothetical protein